MLNYLVELIGTFIFLSVILSQGQAIPIGMALAVSIYFGGSISGGHFNPAVTIMKMLDSNGVSVPDGVAYIVAQVLGGIAALWFYKLNKDAL